MKNIICKVATETEAKYRRIVLAPSTNFDVQYESAYLLKIAEDFCLSDFNVFLTVSALRQEGVQLLRRGELMEGEKKIASARELYANKSPCLCREASISVESFQLAAEAYLFYKNGNSARAVISIADAIRLCNVLASEFDYKVEARIVHLARNVVRVLRLENTVESVRTATKLVRYLYGDVASWPLPDVEMPPTVGVLEMEESYFLIDQILVEIVLAFESISSELLPTLVNEMIALLDALNVSAKRFLQVVVWVEAQIAFLSGDDSTFIRKSTVFFEASNNYLYNSGIALARQLHKACTFPLPSCAKIEM